MNLPCLYDDGLFIMPHGKDDLPEYSLDINELSYPWWALLILSGLCFSPHYSPLRSQINLVWCLTWGLWLWLGNYWRIYLSLIFRLSFSWTLGEFMNFLISNSFSLSWGIVITTLGIILFSHNFCDSYRGNIWFHPTFKVGFFFFLTHYSLLDIGKRKTKSRREWVFHMMICVEEWFLEREEQFEPIY